jgi:hypothetical protein
MPSRWNFARFERREDTAIRFGSMEAVAKSATSFDRRLEAGEEARSLQHIDVHCNEILEARGIDEESSPRKRMQRRRRRRMPTLLTSSIERRDREIQIWNERVQQRTLTHAGRPDESTDLPAGQRFGNRFDALAGRCRHSENVAGSAVDFAEPMGQLASSLEVDLVHDHDRFDSRRPRNHEPAVDIARRLSRFRCNHDAENIEVDGDRALATTGITSTEDPMRLFDDETFANHDHAIPGDCALFGRQPDLTLTPVIETDEYRDPMMGDHSTRFAVLEILRVR